MARLTEFLLRELYSHSAIVKYADEYRYIPARGDRRRGVSAKLNGVEYLMEEERRASPQPWYRCYQVNSPGTSAQARRDAMEKQQRAPIVGGTVLDMYTKDNPYTEQQIAHREPDNLVRIEASWQGRGHREFRTMLAAVHGHVRYEFVKKLHGYYLTSILVNAWHVSEREGQNE